VLECVGEAPGTVVPETLRHPSVDPPPSPPARAGLPTRFQNWNHRGIKPLHWLGDSRERVRAFPPEARQQAGYPLRFAGAVYVRHAFAKKSQQTARQDIDLARRRYASLERIRP
jgi:hypothetical protein